MTIRPDELSEARAIIGALERCDLSDGDRRFVETWRGYLNRTGAVSMAASVSPKRRNTC
jgi:hypothetical protein